jgi:putative transposase
MKKNMIKLISQRKRNRLDEWDYSRDGFYFVTVCVKGMKNIFGDVKNGEVCLNKYGDIVKGQWNWLSQNFEYILLDTFIVMPNHFHGIVIINSKGEFTNEGENIYNHNNNLAASFKKDVNTNNVVTGRDPSLRKIKSLSKLVGAFKTTSSKSIHVAGLINFSWQRSFYDRIIRNEDELNKIRQYIMDNPLKWDYDKNKNENLFY